MSINPYATPNAECESRPDSEGEIRVVVRVFRWLGWLGTIIYVPMVVIPMGTLVYSLTVEQKESPLILIGVILFNGVVLAAFVSMLIAASKLKRQRPDAIKWGRTVSYILLLGFPLLTLVGILCLRRLSRATHLLVEQ